MKSSIICGLSLLISGIAIAQTSQTRQTIVAPVQQISPTAGSTVGGNYSNIDQKGIGSDALVQQQGTANASFIEQTGTDAGNRNSVDVLQWGNVSALSGEENYSEIKQDGAGNNFSVFQQGDKNEVFGTQTGIDNTAIVQQGANLAQQAQDNLALVNQNGKGNFAEVQQRFDNNESSITQDNDAVNGVGNRSYQSQISDGNQTPGHKAIGTQYGDDNEIVQSQDSDYQPFGGDNYAEANQGDAVLTAERAFSQQTQNGGYNNVFSTQYGSDNTSFQEQNGLLNTAEVHQNTLSTGGDNYAEQYQIGGFNEAYIEQDGQNHSANQEQYGVFNESVVIQNGGQLTGNQALTIQSGISNNSYVNQMANGNIADVDQLGMNHVSVINQNSLGTSAGTGGSNSATVTQRNANVSLNRQTQRAAATKSHTF
ncbi:hypothetical protein BST92_10520 [Nonlabens arenilitoris]|uniref:Curlin n=1 Tax=Nonlabens arenilitoris TaxID=1217969 RepID=A0A2S7UDI4_9FLAO|nr:hypothetical protein [Nonlabens arenilitoris]PQJ32333.1 hypothetical protein BST92_10520 [Nonlabens arenilitoris]